MKIYGVYREVENEQEEFIRLFEFFDRAVLFGNEVLKGMWEDLTEVEWRYEWDEVYGDGWWAYLYAGTEDEIRIGVFLREVEVVE